MSNMDRRTNGVQLGLTLQNVRLSLNVPNKPVALDLSTLQQEFTTIAKREAMGDEIPTGLEELFAPWNSAVDQLQRTLARREWRSIREKLLNLQVNSRSDVASWLSGAGYVPRVSGRDLPAWTEDLITEQLSKWLGERSVAIGWLMSQPQRSFPRVINEAWSVWEELRDISGARGDARYLREPLRDYPRRGEQQFRKRFKVPKAVNIALLSSFLIGSAQAPSLRALFHWDRLGKPAIAITADTPIEAIICSVHIDKTFSAVREWVQCANCSKGFEQERSKDKYCSAACKNQYLTYRRRRTERANLEWFMLQERAQQKSDRFEWIAKRVGHESNGKYQVKADWVRNLLTKRDAKRR